MLISKLNLAISLFAILLSLSRLYYSLVVVISNKQQIIVKKIANICCEN